jgi:hypothetical protein
LTLGVDWQAAVKTIKTTRLRSMIFLSIVKILLYV